MIRVIIKLIISVCIMLNCIVVILFRNSLNMVEVSLGLVWILFIVLCVNFRLEYKGVVMMFMVKFEIW